MEDKKNQDILVYTDFTEVGEKSVLWASFLARKFKRNLQIIHVINENSLIYFSKDDTYDEAKEALAALCEDISSTHGIKCKYIVEEGCTCTIINSNAERIDAFFVVLGTHGKNDPQFLSGSSAIKIIRKARIPYFVVQKNSPVPDSKKRFILPMNFKKEAKQKVGWTTYFALNLKLEIDLFYYENPQDNLKKNIHFTNTFFNNYSFKYEHKPQPKKYKSIEKLAVDYADEIDAFCICLLISSKENLVTKIFGFPETSIITNSAGIPVLCVNPKKDLYIPCI